MNNGFWRLASAQLGECSEMEQEEYLLSSRYECTRTKIERRSLAQALSASQRFACLYDNGRLIQEQRTGLLQR